MVAADTTATTAAKQRSLSEPTKIPRDENGQPIGTPWEEVLEDMYNDLSKHYGVDLRTLIAHPHV